MIAEYPPIKWAASAITLGCALCASAPDSIASSGPVAKHQLMRSNMSTNVFVRLRLRNTVGKHRRACVKRPRCVDTEHGDVSLWTKQDA